jgi:DNA gyrase, A subunit
VAEVSRTGRATQGVTFAKPDDGDRIIAVARSTERELESADGADMADRADRADDPDPAADGSAGEEPGSAGEQPGAAQSETIGSEGAQSDDENPGETVADSAAPSGGEAVGSGDDESEVQA